MSIASRELIGQAVDLIEKSLKEPLSLDDVSRHLHLSKYHMHRLFKSLTGQPLMSYVRGRRLCASIADLLTTERKIIDIAEEYQFDYEQSYERAFKRRFGLSPGDFRRRRCELEVISKVDCGLIYDLPQGVLLSPRYCIVPSFCVAGVEELINHAENLEKSTANTLALDFYHTMREKIPDRIHDSVYYGLIIESEDPGTANHYMPCTQVRCETHLPPPLLCRTIPTETYAVFRYVGFHSPEQLSMLNLGSLYLVIDQFWSPNTEYMQASPYHFERMDLANCSSTYCEADIYMPVKIH